MDKPSEYDVDFDNMTKAELLDFAEAYGIDGVDSSMLKANILAAVKAAYYE